MILGVPGQRRCIVVGAGLLGLATAWSLSRRGWRVSVVEAAWTIGHARSGSKGSARIFRFGYPDPLYVELALTAQRLWRDLEATSGRTLLSETGQVTLGDDNVLQAIASAMAGCGLPTQQLGAEEATRRFPSMSARGPVLFEPASGVLRADECLAALRSTGTFEVRTGLPVDRVEDRGDAGVVIRAGGVSLRAERGVVCAGPRSLDLLGWRARVAAPASFPQVAYFEPKERGDAPRPPVFVEWSDDMIYGLPVRDDQPGSPPLFKVSHHTPGDVADDFDPTDPSPLSDDPVRLERLCDAVERLLPSLDPVPVLAERCVYDNSADSDFIVDRAGGFVVGCGTSGHGFKFGPALGELLADLVEGVETPFGGDRFRLERPVPPSARWLDDSVDPPSPA
jgi:sarcosine oxidase